MKEYTVLITASMLTAFTAENEDEAIFAAEEWCGEEYGNLTHRADFKIVDGDE